jgi:LacI family transcriptional regulator
MKASARSPSVTLRDIAQKLGIHHSTVGRALQNASNISLARRKEIQEAAREMGYQPNAMATILGHQRHAHETRTISAEIAWINCWRTPNQLRKYREYDLYWKGASFRAEQNGYRLEEFICGDRISPSRLEQILETRNIHGILLPPLGGGQPLPLEWNHINWKNFSIVRFGYSVATPHTHLVTSNQWAAGQIAIENMWRLGYRRIGFVANSDRLRNFKGGFFMKQSELGPEVKMSLFEYSSAADFSDEDRRFSVWLKKNRPEALLTDAIQTRETLAKLGYRIPEDIGLAATSILDGNSDAGIDQNSEEIGKAAAETLISLINHRERGIPDVVREVLITGKWADGTTLPPR